MKSFSTSTTIHAPAAKIWSILTDAAAYPRWNPTVTKIDGDIELGKKITVHATISPGRAFPVKVEALEPNERMVWASGMPLGLFRGARTFTLSPRGDGAIEFAMREEFTGLMAPLITKSIPDLTPAFEAFAAALKGAAEA